MRLYRAGDPSAGVCEACRRTVRTRMEYRDYTPAGWSVTVPDVLVSACEACGGVVGVPHQSTPRINEYRPAGGDQSRGIEARVPRGIEDALELVVATLGGQPKAVRPAVLRYYLGLVARSPEVAEAVKVRSAGPLAMGKAGRRLAVKLPARQRAETLSAMRDAGIGGAGQLLRGVAALAAEDCAISYGQAGPATPRPDKASRARRAFLEEMARSL